MTDEEKQKQLTAMLKEQFGPDAPWMKQRDRFRAAIELRKAAQAYAETAADGDIELAAVNEIRLQVAAFVYARFVPPQEQDDTIKMERGL